MTSIILIFLGITHLKFWLYVHIATAGIASSPAGLRSARDAPEVFQAPSGRRRDHCSRRRPVLRSTTTLILFWNV